MVSLNGLTSVNLVSMHGVQSNLETNVFLRKYIDYWKVKTVNQGLIGDTVRKLMFELAVYSKSVKEKLLKLKNQKRKLDSEQRNNGCNINSEIWKKRKRNNNAEKWSKKYTKVLEEINLEKIKRDSCFSSKKDLIAFFATEFSFMVGAASLQR
jgi:hypothetical protein